MIRAMDAMKRRMLAGEWYLDDTPGLESDRMRCQELVAQYNATAPVAAGERRRLLGELLGGVGEDVDIRPPVFFDYGHQTTVGDRTFINAGVTILDVGRVTIGAEVQIGPGVQLLTPTHPLDPARRRAGWEAQKPIVIEDGVWLGGGVIVCPGVTIGENSVIGAGAVVTRDVPAGVVAVGNPCRVLRPLPPDEPPAAG